jgi:hypothetical protein
MQRRPEYWLARHVYLCRAHDSVVFLDLKRATYLGLGGKQLRALEQLVHEMPAGPGVAACAAMPLPEAAGIADIFIQDGLLTRDPSQGKPATPAAPSHTPMIAVQRTLASPRRISAVDVVRFIAACVRAATALKIRSADRIVRGIALRKERYAHGAASFDMVAASDAVDIFRRLRTYGFTAKHQCLFHALALTHFLAYYGVYATWIIGVKTRPFAAHSWVQHDAAILDGTPEEVRFYTPILTV